MNMTVLSVCVCVCIGEKVFLCNKQ